MSFRVVREGISRILNGSVGFLPPSSVKAANGTWFLRKSGTIMISAPFGKSVIGVVTITKQESENNPVISFLSRLTFFCKTDSSRCSQNPKHIHLRH